ncbi:MAG: zinc ribbon domain-containing protein [Clostridiales bacterium]|nr:zinc ribbon domain-containing protein [Clostridiales bacterium]
MVFCNNCGSRLPDNAKFCNKCGSKVSIKPAPPKDDNTFYTNTVDNESENRKEVYVGTVKKCPYCGEILESKYGNCPSCGHAIQSQSISSNLVDFINKVDDCEDNIQRQPKPVVKSTGGFSTWSSSTKILFVISNFVFCCYPLIIYVIWRAIKTAASTPTLTNAEKELTRLIQNFPFPNDQETMTDAILYINSKMDFLSNLDYNEKTPYWAKLWKAKADELYHKSTTIYRGNSTISNTYTEICNKFNSIRAEEKKRHKTTIIIIGAAIAGIAIMLIIYLVFFYERPDYSTYNSSLTNNYYSTLNDYDYGSYTNTFTNTTTTATTATSRNNSEEVLLELDGLYYVLRSLNDIEYLIPQTWSVYSEDTDSIKYYNEDTTMMVEILFIESTRSINDGGFDNDILETIGVDTADAIIHDTYMGITHPARSYMFLTDNTETDQAVFLIVSDCDGGLVVCSIGYEADNAARASMIITNIVDSFVFEDR